MGRFIKTELKKLPRAGKKMTKGTKKIKKRQPLRSRPTSFKKINLRMD
jgi:hypothetical protein